MPNIIEQQDQVMGLSKEALINYAQNPSGALPMFLVVERIKDLGDQEKRFLAQQEQPQGTVSEQIVAEATAPQGIGALQPQMPPGASGGAMPPSNAMPQPPMPPEMISAQMNAQSQMLAATGGRMPYPAMAGGGMVPPNSLVEDASKFNPQSMYDMDPSQMAMAKPTNMGIASVLPMAAGGVVRMKEGGYQEFRDSVAGGAREALGVGGDVLDWIIDQYTDEDGTVDWSNVALTAATFTPLGWAARGTQLATKLPAIGRGIKSLYQSRNVLPPSVRSNLGQRIAAQLGQKGPGRGRKGGQEWHDRLIKEHPWRAGALAAKSVGSGVGRAFSYPFRRYPKTTRGTLGLALIDSMLDAGTNESAPASVTSEPSVFNGGASEPPGSRADAIAFILENQNNQTNELSGGGVIRMREGSLTAIDDTQQPVPTNMTDAEIALHLQELKRQGHPIPPNLEHFLAPTGPKTDTSNGSVTNYENMIRASEADIGRDTDGLTDAQTSGLFSGALTPGETLLDGDSTLGSNVFQKHGADALNLRQPGGNESSSADGEREDRDVRPRSPLSVNDRLLSMLSERMGTIENLLKTETSLPDYEALRANITEGVDDDVVASILTSIGKSIYEGKGLAGADVSEAQAIKQKMRDSLSALELAKAKGLSDKEIADLDRQLTAQTSMLAAIPAPQRSINPLTGRTTLGKLQYELAEMKARDPNDPNIALHEAAIGRLTDDRAGDEIMKLIDEMSIGRMVDGEYVFGPASLSAGKQARWDALIEGNRSISDILTRNIALEFESS